MKATAELIGIAQGGLVKYQEAPARSNEIKAQFVSELEAKFNSFFAALKAIYPSLSYSIKSDADLQAFKKQWIFAFGNSGISDIEMLEAGLNKARLQGGDFVPSVSRFISWCYDSLRNKYQIPDANKLTEKVKIYSSINGLYEYRAKSDAEYWLVTGLYQKMIDGSLSGSELIKQAEKDTNELIKKIIKGYVIPKPNQIIEFKRPQKSLVTPERGLEIIKELRKKHGLRA